jgi:hypothetical protein
MNDHNQPINVTMLSQVQTEMDDLKLKNKKLDHQLQMRYILYLYI